MTNLLNRSHWYWHPFQSGWSSSHLATQDITPSQTPSLQHFSLWASRELQPAEPEGCLSALLTLTPISLLQDQPHICSQKTQALLVLHMADRSARKCWQESRWQWESQTQLLEEILVFLLERILLDQKHYKLLFKYYQYSDEYIRRNTLISIYALDIYCLSSSAVENKVLSLSVFHSEA